MLIGKPILAGESDIHQLELIWDLMGSPNEENMPGWKQLPGADQLSPRVRTGNLQSRFREYVGPPLLRWTMAERLGGVRGRGDG